MKIEFFNNFALGVVKGDQIVDVSGVVAEIPRITPQDILVGLINQYSVFKDKLNEATD